jgi:thiol:disulfide interchange protein DsbD
MKSIITSWLLILFSFYIKAQEQNPITWMANYKAINSSEGIIVITANIVNGWHMFSQKPTDAGPVPTSFIFQPSKQFQLIGTTEEIGAKEEFIKEFDATLFLFSSKAEFSQKVKLLSKTVFNIKFKVEYMCCNDKMCLPPKTIELIIKTQ